MRLPIPDIEHEQPATVGDGRLSLITGEQHGLWPIVQRFTAWTQFRLGTLNANVERTSLRSPAAMYASSTGAWMSEILTHTATLK